MKASYKVSLGGILGALSLGLMLLTSIVPFGTFAFPAFAGMLLVCVVVELGFSWAFVVYSVVSALSLLFVSDKEAALYYVIFLGFYPIVKGMIEKIRSKIIQYAIKYILFNICIISAFYISLFVLSIPKESFTVFDVYLPWAFLVAGNVVFLFYDYCVSRIVTLYLLKIRSIITKNTKM